MFREKTFKPTYYMAMYGKGLTLIGIILDVYAFRHDFIMLLYLFTHNIEIYMNVH
jgi:hypothetical protein